MSVIIDIAAEFTGKKAFKSAETSTDKLTKSVSSLGKKLGLALSVGAILAYGKAAVKAAAQDEQAQKQLALALKNVGLGRDVAITESFIARLESEFGVVDDKLRPAYQSLAIATQSTSESQKLLGIALDISSANSLDLEAVTSALSKAYLGNNTALGKLNVGISKADLKTKSFDEIVNDLAKTFKGAATTSAKSFAGQMAKLSVSVSNAQEIIGKGLIDSLMILTESEDIDQLQTKIVALATNAAEGFRKLAGFVKENETMFKSIAKILAATFVATKIIAGIAALIKAIKAITTAMAVLRATSIGAAIAQMAVLNPFAAAAFAAGLVGIIGATIKGVDALVGKYTELNGAMENAQGLAHLAELQARYPIKILATKKKITEEEQKTLKAKQLQLAIDKANKALGKGTGVFDLDKIQLAAAEKAAAEQLGKATSEAQLLAITNDLARLQVKEDMLALEDAIASKDVAAIAAATAKLNGDLLILGALTNQEVKLLDIEEILAALLPKELIDLANLDEAIAKLIALSKIVINPVVPVAPGTPGTPTMPPVLTDAEIEKLLKKGLPPPSGGKGGSGSAGDYPSEGFPGANKPYVPPSYEAFDPARGGMTSGGQRPTQSNNTTNVTITVNESLDPNLTATRIQKILTDAANNTGNVYDLGTGSKNTSYVV
jgi:hypothetical protein